MLTRGDFVKILVMQLGLRSIGLILLLVSTTLLVANCSREPMAEPSHPTPTPLLAGRVPVQVTFAHPLSVEELRLLTQRTGLVADLVIFEARDASYGLHTVAARGTGVDVIDLGNLAPGLDSRGLRLVGATAVRGIVPASGLAQLATDERVYLPDVTPHRLAVEVAARYGVSVDKVQVSVPTPHWYISAGR